MRTSGHSALRRELPGSQHIPYLTHVSEHLVLTRSGDCVQAFRLGGSSFECADDVELNAWHERLNLTLRNIASPNVALWTHLIRRREAIPVDVPDTPRFAEQLERRYQSRLAGETLMANVWYVSLVYRPVVGAAPSLLARALQRGLPATSDTWAAIEEVCTKLAQVVQSALAQYEPERLGVETWNGRPVSRLLEFLGLLINGESRRWPLVRSSLQSVLATTRPLFGTEVIEYRTASETHFGAMLGIKEYPTPTLVGMYDALLRAPFPFVLSQSFTFLSKSAGQSVLLRQRARMANAGDFAVSQAAELDEALDALSGNAFVMGDHHFTLQVREEGEGSGASAAQRIARLNKSVATATTLLSDAGMTVAREDLALEAAFWAQLPGNFSYRPRKSPITSRNFAAMSNFHNYPAGRQHANHWGSALTVLMTAARSPYHFSLHASGGAEASGSARRDTGHTFLCGPTGSGKTVLIGFLVALLSRRGVTQVVFDKDRGLELLVRALDGEYRPIRNGQPTGFNPLQLPDSPASLEFQKTWLRALVAGATPLSVKEESDLDHALHGTLALDPARRRLSRLIEFTDATRTEGLHGRLARWCASTGGDYHWVFDNAEDSLAHRLSAQRLMGFDVTDFLNHELLRSPVALYLFHCIRQYLDGRRFVCWADEFSRLLADERFAQFAKDGLKVWRKLDGVFCAATQSPSDALQSAISRTIIEQTATKIFFPNPDADAGEYMNGFGLSEREVALIRSARPGSRSFLLKQGQASVVCELDLAGFEAELAILSGRGRDRDRVYRLMDGLGASAANWWPAFARGEGGTGGVA